LYGAVAIMSAELGFIPGRITPYEAATGALLVGLAMALTRTFVEIVKQETEIGSHMASSEVRSLLGNSLLVMAFPGGVSVMVVLGALLQLRTGTVADAVPYISMITVLFLGFGSSYVLDRAPLPALLRGVSWTLLCLVLFVAKQLE
jgi:hypothetical protein